MMEPNNAKLHKIDRNQEEDEISQLPESLLYHILAYLPIKEATRTSCLSKTWYTAWNSSPGLKFDQDAFEGTRRFRSYKERVQEFCNYVDESIRRCRQSNIPIQKFELCFNINGVRDRVLETYVRKWLDYATSNKLDQLVVRCNSPYKSNSGDTKGMWPFRLPESLFRVKSLKELELSGCNIPTSNTFEFSLKKLCLSLLEVDQQTLQGMLSSNRLLEKTSIMHCRGFMKVKLDGLKLEKLSFAPMLYESQTIEVEAPNVQAIRYAGSHFQRSIPDCNCKNLRKVIFHHAPVTLDFLQSMPSKFPALENLELWGCWMSTSNENSNSCLLSNIQGCVKRKELESSDLLSVISSFSNIKGIWYQRN